MRDSWVGLQAGVDARGWARLLRRAHDSAVNGGHVPAIVREVIAASWQRCSETGVDPAEPGAPLVIDPEDAGRALARASAEPDDRDPAQCARRSALRRSPHRRGRRCRRLPAVVRGPPRGAARVGADPLQPGSRMVRAGRRHQCRRHGAGRRSRRPGVLGRALPLRGARLAVLGRARARPRDGKHARRDRRDRHLRHGASAQPRPGAARRPPRRAATARRDARARRADPRSVRRARRPPRRAGGGAQPLRPGARLHRRGVRRRCVGDRPDRDPRRRLGGRAARRHRSGHPSVGRGHARAAQPPGALASADHAEPARAARQGPGDADHTDRHPPADRAPFGDRRAAVATPGRPGRPHAVAAALRRGRPRGRGARGAAPAARHPRPGAGHPSLPADRHRRRPRGAPAPARRRTLLGGARR